MKENITELISKQLQLNLEVSNKTLYAECNAKTDNEKGSVRKIKSRLLSDLETKNETSETTKTKGKEKDLMPLIPPKTANPPSQPTQLSKEEVMKIVSNPVEFVQFLIVEELWKTRDVRWANLFTTILDKTKKLDYETIQEAEWLNQAKTMSLEEIVSKVAIKGSISRSTSRRLDELDDTSRLDNFLEP